MKIASQLILEISIGAESANRKTDSDTPALIEAWEVKRIVGYRKTLSSGETNQGGDNPFPG